MAFQYCEYCGTSFKAMPHQKRRFCSRSCRAKAIPRKRIVLKDRTCCVCGKIYRPKSSTSRFCSQECARPKLVQEGKHKTYYYDITWEMLTTYELSLPIGVGFATWAAIQVGCCSGTILKAVKRLNYPAPVGTRFPKSVRPSHTFLAKIKKTPCVICGETRVIDAAHIVPRRLRGSGEPDNIIPLCPTHHRCFDRGLLTAEETAKLNNYRAQWTNAQKAGV